MLDIKVEGIDEVLESLEEITNPRQLDKAMGKACAVVERAAKRNAPKGKGDLRRSIASEVKQKPDGVEGIVFTPLEYAPYVEYGTGLFAEEGGRQDVPWRYQDDEGNWHTTSGQHPQPFMRPALTESEKRIKKIIKEALIK